MKFKNLFWLFSLVMFANLCFVSCDKDDDKSDKPSVQKDGVYCKELDSVLNLKKNAAIDSVGITILDEIPDFEIIKKALNDYPKIKVSLNLENCTGLNGIPDEALKTKDRKDGMTNLVSITLPENITKIGEKAFYDCTGLTTIVIPQNVSFIGDYAFEGCNAMKTITLQCTTPPEYDGKTLDNIHIFYVPESAVETYKNDKIWIEFAKKITAIGTELIEEPEPEPLPSSNLSATVNDGLFRSITVSCYSYSNSEISGVTNLSTIFGTTDGLTTISGTYNNKQLIITIKGTETGTYKLDISNNITLISILCGESVTEVTDDAVSIENNAMIIYRTSYKTEGNSDYWFSTKASITIDLSQSLYATGNFTAKIRNKYGDTFEITDGKFNAFVTADNK